MDASTPRDLARLQRWMQTVVTHPDGIVGGIDSLKARAEIGVTAETVEQVITRSRALGSIQRLQVYGNAYYARLLECLENEFPALRYAVGEQTFAAFAFGYLQAQPSRSYTLNALGAKFSQYLAETRPARDGDTADWADFLVDLARLERAYSDVFDGPGVEHQRLLTANDLRDVSVDAWPEARLQTVPCLRLEEFQFSVHEYATAVRQRRDDQPIPIPAPQHTPLVITRRDYVVRRFAVTPPQFVLLKALSAQETIGEAISRAAEETDAGIDALSADLRQWFQEWTSAGLFVAVRLPGAM